VWFPLWVYHVNIGLVSLVGVKCVKEFDAKYFFLCLQSGHENDLSEEEDIEDRMSNHSRNEQPMKPSIDPDVLARLKQVIS